MFIDVTATYFSNFMFVICDVFLLYFIDDYSAVIPGMGPEDKVEISSQPEENTSGITPGTIPGLDLDPNDDKNKIASKKVSCFMKLIFCCFFIYLLLNFIIVIKWQKSFLTIYYWSYNVMLVRTVYLGESYVLRGRAL